MTSNITPALFLGVLALGGCGKEAEPEHHRKKITAVAPPPGVEVDTAKLSMFAALPAAFDSKTNPTTEERVALGRTLFHDPALSKDRKVSCNTCHDLSNSGADGMDFSTTSGGKKTERNTPTVLDAAGQFAQFWDGRSETVEQGTVVHVVEMMAMQDDKHVVGAVKAVPAYGEAFKKAFPDDAEALTADNVAKALGAFERRLVTPSKWDGFLKGDQAALADDAKKGFLKFVEVGCPTCHVGPLVGGTMFQKLGKEKPWPNAKDKGRSAVTKAPSDDMMFKVAQLRNVEHTGPYFHDASAKTLEDAVKTMASYQLGKDLSDPDVASIVVWLKTLTAPLDAELAKKPAAVGAGSASVVDTKKAVPAGSK
jgi:cytochrome c peroxidase